MTNANNAVAARAAKFGVTKTRGAKRIVACRKKEGSTAATKCQECKKAFQVGGLYWAFGLRATTLYEKRNARKGCVWYYFCAACK